MCLATRLIEMVVRFCRFLDEVNCPRKMKFKNGWRRYDTASHPKDFGVKMTTEFQECKRDVREQDKKEFSAQ